jgi:hypothetical protein
MRLFRRVQPSTARDPEPLSSSQVPNWVDSVVLPQVRSAFRLLAPETYELNGAIVQGNWEGVSVSGFDISYVGHLHSALCDAGYEVEVIGWPRGTLNPEGDLVVTCQEYLHFNLQGSVYIQACIPRNGVTS